MNNQFINALAVRIAAFAVTLVVNPFATALAADKPAGQAPPQQQESSSPTSSTTIVHDLSKMILNVTPPKPVYEPQPSYTQEARNQHIQGTVVLLIVVDSKGDVTSAKLNSKPLGYGLDESALTTVRTWKFRPAIREGKSVPVLLSVEVSFRLFDGLHPPQAPMNQVPQKPNPVPEVMPGPQLEPPAKQELSNPGPRTGTMSGLGLELPPGFNATPPEPTWRPDPTYTEEAEKHHIDGTVAVQIDISAEGAVTGVELKSPPLGFGLDESVLNTVRTWKFKPSMRDGKPVPVQVGAKFTFRLFDRRNSPPGILMSVETLPGVENAMTPAKPISTPDPEYTEKARRARLEGTVTVEVNVDKKGRVVGAIAMGPELGMGLDKQAVKAARKWKFEPATLRGKPIAVVGKIQVTFKLDK